MNYGHWGKALRVNLSTGNIVTQALDATFLRRYVGGWGFIAYTLLKELAPGINPLGPENRLVFATGPLAGQTARSHGG